MRYTLHEMFIYLDNWKHFKHPKINEIIEDVKENFGLVINQDNWLTIFDIVKTLYKVRNKVSKIELDKKVKDKGIFKWTFFNEEV